MQEIYESNLSQVELAKRLKIMKGITVSDADFDDLKKRFVKNEDVSRIDGIINGLSQEDEFAILCKMMERCSTLTALDQTPVIESDEIAADFLASFYPSASILDVPPCEDVKFNCMVEIKSTKKLKLKISRNDLQNRIAFSKKFNLPLLYAVRFTRVNNNALWVIVDSAEIEKNCRVELNHFVTGIGSILFDNYSVIINSEFTIVEHYKEGVESDSYISNQYGKLIKTYIIDESGIKFTANKSDSLLLSILLGIFDTYESYIEKTSESTFVYSKFKIGHSVFLTDILYATINMAVNDAGEKAYDPTRYISNMDSQNKKTIVPTRSLFEDLFSRVNMSCKNFFLYGLIDDVEKNKNKLLNLVGDQNNS
ncbi:hypothetical protein [Chromobacterium violaceum]|uniref:Uncharacterized protein n=1 Tax=Chromobacterium violaceum TaxID=536 RepID=A0AAX2MAA3_CHRVL|nr:hypothetical protein [Chromobacterium violaceum]STB64503.1 Uncharacterised protein [Chromobacterium violaceum]SUX33427.1 Uncharacterised protein [Chromobacterium violaceum]